MPRWASALLLILAWPAAHAAAQEGCRREEWIGGIYTGLSPHPVSVQLNDAWSQAAELARRQSGAFVLRGSGDSMNPLYAPGTILVLCEVRDSELRWGQTVVFRNLHQRAVAHVLVARTRDGWRTQGVNNAAPDATPVQPGNLVGVVIAAFLPTGSD